MTYRSFLRTALLSATVMAGLGSTSAYAQVADGAAEEGQEVIIVTGTRRNVALQDAPINITAIGATQMAEQGIDNVRDLSSFTPGITIQDTGPRNTGTIVLRGLNASDTGSTGDNNNNALATYIGEVPLYLDLKFLDINRVETLLGPQGTLYGQGTLAGAIRFIPNRPDPEKWTGSFHARAYGVSHASDPGFQVDGTINVPIIPGKVAFRSTVGYYDDPGFIDYNYLLNEPSVSIAQPLPSTVRFGAVGTPTGTPGVVSSFYGPIGTADQIAANLHSYKDANFEQTFTTRNQLGLFPWEGVNIYLTYAFQKTKTNGRQANGGGVLGTGKYEAPWRYLEPSNRKSSLLSAEIEAEIGGFAQLVSATAYTDRKIKSSSDVTDLLLDLDYNYELFPAFSGFTNSDVRYKQFNQELRLVSAHGGPFSWIVGGFYNELKFRSDYEEIDRKSVV
jgi:outer membrane receptor protein involved in Fe transport